MNAGRLFGLVAAVAVVLVLFVPALASAAVFGDPQVVAPGAVRGAAHADDGSLAVVSSEERDGTTTFWRAERAAAATAFGPAERLVEEVGRTVPRTVAYARTPAGAEALAWATTGGTAVRLLVRERRGMAFGAVEQIAPPPRAPVKPGNETTVSEPFWQSLDAAVAADGAVAVAGCEEDYGSETSRALLWFRPPGGEGRWEEIGRCVTTVRVRADALGRIDVLWSGAPDGAARDAPRVIWVATRPPAAAAFSPKQGLSDPREDADNNASFPELHTAATGEALALWNAGEYPVGTRVMLATRDLAGRWSAPQRLSQEAGFRPSAATSTRGAIAVAWSSGQRLATALKPAGQTFRSPVVAFAGELLTQSLPVAVDSFDAIVAVGHGFRDGRIYGVRRLPDGTTLPPEVITQSGFVAADLRLETDRFGNGALAWTSFPVGRPSEARATVASYSARPPVLDRVKVTPPGVSFDVDEPARITVTATAGARSATQTAAVTPGRGRETVRATGRLRSLLRARGARRVTIRARDAGPGSRRVRRTLRARG